MAKIGYARVSSKEQHLDRQLAALKDVDKLFTDKLSGANTNRPELQKMLAYIREGDIVMVTELDRLGRNNQDLTQIMNTIRKIEPHQSAGHAVPPFVHIPEHLPLLLRHRGLPGGHLA